MASNFRRLAADHASLHNAGLPPNYLFPPSSSSLPDDLTQLTILLTGHQGTPYSQGLWKLHLRIPEDYPQSPPKASFRTRIWHPNVEESTGAVCVDTLKKDWEAKLTLKDVLVTISCLLIYPNPDSALNSAAGALLQDNYEEFSRQAKLMTSIHAPIPQEMKAAVVQAKRRGDHAGATLRPEADGDDSKPLSFSLTTRKKTPTSSLIMKNRSSSANHESPNSVEKLDIRVKQPSPAGLRPNQQHDQGQHTESDMEEDENDEENPLIASKENNPSLSPSPVIPPAPPSPRKNASVLGKRPLSVLSAPTEPDLVLVDTEDPDEFDGMSASERNIAANLPQQQQHGQADIETEGTAPDGSQLRKSPKLSELSRSLNVSSRARGEIPSIPERKLPEEAATSMADCGTGIPENINNKGKENAISSTIWSDEPSTTTTVPCPTTINNNKNNPGKPSTLSKAPSSATTSATTRKVSSSATKQNTKPRIGVRRL